MEVRSFLTGLQLALRGCRPAPRQLPIRPIRQYATSGSVSFRRGDLRNVDALDKAASESMASEEDEAARTMKSLRVLPASPSYFTAVPRFTDDLITLEELLRKHSSLPILPPGEQPRVAWLTYQQYTASSTEPVRNSAYAKLMRTLVRLNQIHPALIPDEVTNELQRFKRTVQPKQEEPAPLELDRFGRSRAVGRRKSSHAIVYVVEGEGEVRVNGRELPDMFSRLHDRESAVWPLKATGRLGLYNVWAICRGGGTTGQAEAMTLGVAKALLVHEPGLKPVLRRAGCVTRDVRTVERKKAGKLKARKMPAWVKR